jgi:L-ascorbate metabolism protein UlaG (beta-lactamase superfamily)
VKITYLGTASVLIDYAGQRFLTDPVFDPSGRTYSMGPAGIPERWFASTRDYEAPMSVEQVGHVDAALLSHDHHRDNLDVAGRALLYSDAVDRILTTPAAAKRMKLAKVTGLRTGGTARLGAATVTATPAQHGPRWIPQTSQVTGFELRAPEELGLWISGDTILTDAVRDAARRMRGIDVAVIHAGGVRFPSAPLVGKAVFTFTPEQFVEVCTILDPRVIVPIHRSGWTHFEPENALRAALADAGLLERTRWLQLGETAEF